MNAEQLAALKRFAKSHGKGWKHRLKDVWFVRGAERGIPDAPLLRQIRNQFGPEWLDNLELEKLNGNTD